MLSLVDTGRTGGANKFSLGRKRIHLLAKTLSFKVLSELLEPGPWQPQDANYRD